MYVFNIKHWVVVFQYEKYWFVFLIRIEKYELVVSVDQKYWLQLSKDQKYINNNINNKYFCSYEQILTCILTVQFIWSKHFLAIKKFIVLTL